MNKTILALILASTLAASVQAQGPLGDLSASGTVGYESAYVFRGKKITNSALQPRIEFGEQWGANTNLYAGAWSNQPLSRRTSGVGADQTNELDLYGGVIYVLPEGWKLDLGGIYYWYQEAGGSSVPNQNGAHLDRSVENYFGTTYTAPLAGYNLISSAYFYHDWILDSNTAEVSTKYVWDLSLATGMHGLSFVPQAVIGWTGAHRAWGDQTVLPAGFAPGNPKGNWRNSYIYWKGVAELDYAISDWCTLYLSGSYAANNDQNGLAPYGASTGETAQNGGTKSNFWLGGGLKFSK